MCNTMQRKRIASCLFVDVNSEGKNLRRIINAKHTIDDYAESQFAEQQVEIGEINRRDTASTLLTQTSFSFFAIL